MQKTRCMHTPLIEIPMHFLTWLDLIRSIKCLLRSRRLREERKEEEGNCPVGRHYYVLLLLRLLSSSRTNEHFCRKPHLRPQHAPRKRARKVRVCVTSFLSLPLSDRKFFLLAGRVLAQMLTQETPGSRGGGCITHTRGPQDGCSKKCTASPFHSLSLSLEKQYINSRSSSPTFVVSSYSFFGVPVATAWRRWLFPSFFPSLSLSPSLSPKRERERVEAKGRRREKAEAPSAPSVRRTRSRGNNDDDSGECHNNSPFSFSFSLLSPPSVGRDHETFSSLSLFGSFVRRFLVS